MYNWSILLPILRKEIVKINIIMTKCVSSSLALEAGSANSF